MIHHLNEIKNLASTIGFRVPTLTFMPCLLIWQQFCQKGVSSLCFVTMICWKSDGKIVQNMWNSHYTCITLILDYETPILPKGISILHVDV